MPTTKISVPDPLNFDVYRYYPDPDPRIRLSEKWIRIPESNIKNWIRIPESTIRNSELLLCTRQF